MVNELGYLKESASQTAGPYVHIGLAPHQAGFDIFERNFSNVIAGPRAEGERIAIEGRVIDGSGTPVRDVLIEQTWRAVRDDVVYVPLHRQVLVWALHDGLELPIDPGDMPRFRSARLTGPGH